jgi:hypothetical protein
MPPVERAAYQSPPVRHSLRLGNSTVVALLRPLTFGGWRPGGSTASPTATAGGRVALLVFLRVLLHHAGAAAGQRHPVAIDNFLPLLWNPRANPNILVCAALIVRLAMAPLAERADGLTIAPESRDELERVVVRLLDIAGRCGDNPVIQHELMQLSDELAKIIDEIK